MSDLEILISSGGNYIIVYINSPKYCIILDGLSAIFWLSFGASLLFYLSVLCVFRYV